MRGRSVAGVAGTGQVFLARGSVPDTMAFDPETVETIAFDSYGTLVDVSSVEDALSEHVDDAEVVARLWRERSLQYAMVGNAIDEYDSFFELIRHALTYALDVHGIDLDDDEREAVLSAYDDLDVFADVHGGMERLREAGYDLYIVSNGSEAMLSTLVDHADLAEYLEDTVSAEEVEQYKPVPDLYRHAAERIGTPIEEIAFVGAGWWDVPGAMNAGMQGVWINRQETLWGPYDVDPDLTVESFHDVADELGA
jgi:2-haloacid dehalogenase